MRLIQLAYVSTSRLGHTPAEWRLRVERIVAGARKLNGINGITGYLMFDGVEFAQILEGDEAAVMGTFLRILADHAHTNVNVLVRGPIVARRFAEWQMGLAIREEPIVKTFIRHGFINPGDIGNATLEPLLALAVELAGQAPPQSPEQPTLP
ncbi:MAG: BLUF domain-containing protein [Bosea sp. (in: a-proteobacteria)]